MSIRSRMIMRAVVTREIKDEVDAYNQPVSATTNNGKKRVTVGIDVPCRIYYDTQTRRTHIERQPTITYEANPVFAEFPLNEDIQALDVLERVDDRRGNQLFGQMEVLSVMRRGHYFQLILKERK